MYCAAMGRGLMTGDAAGAADVVAEVMGGGPGASDQLRGLYASLLAFDGRSAEALKVAGALVEDPTVHPVARTFAAIGAVGAEYWLGHTRHAAALADAVVPVAATIRGALPFGAASIELMAICALLDQGELDRAEERAHRMRAQAAADGDPFTGPRGEYCLARVELVRGRPATAERGFAELRGRTHPVRPVLLAPYQLDAGPGGGHCRRPDHRTPEPAGVCRRPADEDLRAGVRACRGGTARGRATDGRGRRPRGLGGGRGRR